MRFKVLFTDLFFEIFSIIFKVLGDVCLVHLN